MSNLRSFIRFCVRDVTLYCGANAIFLGRVTLLLFLLYSIQSGTFESGKMTSTKKDDSDSDSDDEVEKGEKLTDDQLFKACGGMTAHK